MPRQAEFAGLSVGLEPLPDETLFSWCSRYHRLAATGHDRATCLQLFGDHRAGTAHDFPAQVAVLAAKTSGAIGTAAELIRQRTLLPFYLPFRSLALGQRAEQALCGQGIGHLKYQLGLLTSGLGAAHPLKACPLCVADDISLHGWAYWRRDHQLPGVWLCTQHQVPLRVYPQKMDQLARFSWVLPTPVGSQPVACLSGLEPVSSQVAWLLKMGSLSMALVDCAPGRIDDPVRIGEAIRGRLRHLGYIQSARRVRWSMLEPTLEQMSTNLACLPELNHQSDPVLLRNQLLRLLSGRALTHPLRYLAWIANWFSGLDDFLDVYATADPAAPIRAQSSIKTQAVHHGPNEYQRHVLLQATERHISLTAAAKQAGVSYATMAAWASRQAFEPSRRPKKLSSSIWDDVVTQLRNGADKETVAQAFAISIVTVTRVLQTVPGLRDQWHSERQEQRRIIARRAWEEVATLRAYLGIKALRRLEPAAYAWLYRNDREWLKMSSNSVPKVPATNHAVARMHGADARMAEALRGLATLHAQRKQPWSFDELKRAMPALRRLIRCPEKWPLTVKALAFVLAAPKLEHPLLDAVVEQSAVVK
ncbi:MAG: hypothetical protein HGA75_01945 [Thiobacillus sp.]|nr:hypothetical protein [Thiobacillus sp.]